MRHIAFALLVGVVAAAGLRAQEGVAARLAGRVSLEVASAVQELAAAAAARGLPVEPLVEKAIEGGAKGVSAERIVAGVKALAAQLDEGASALRSAGVAAPDADAVEAAAYTLNAGLSRRQLEQLVRASVPPYAPTGTLRVAGTLAALGVPAKETVELVEQAIKAGRAPGDLFELPSQVRAGMARGASAQAAAAGLARAAAHAPSPQPRRPPPAQGRPHHP